MGNNNYYPKIARKALEYFFETKRILVLKKIPKELEKRAGVFVSLHEKNTHQLRGCIGTFLPTKNNLAEEIVNNALAAAFEDPRFPPLQKSELKNIEINVDVLSEPRPARSREELDPKKYGVIVSIGYRKGLLLPDLEGVDTIEDQLAIACQKAGIAPNENYQIEKFEVKRYRE